MSVQQDNTTAYRAAQTQMVLSCAPAQMATCLTQTDAHASAVVYSQSRVGVFPLLAGLARILAKTLSASGSSDYLTPRPPSCSPSTTELMVSTAAAHARLTTSSSLMV